MSEIVKRNRFYEGQGGGTVEEPKGRFTDPTPTAAEDVAPSVPITTAFARPVAEAEPVNLGGDRMEIKCAHSRSLVGHNLAFAVTAGRGRTIARVKATLDGAVVYDGIGHGQKMSWSGHNEGSASPGDDHTLLVQATDDRGDVQEEPLIWTDES